MILKIKFKNQFQLIKQPLLFVGLICLCFYITSFFLSLVIILSVYMLVLFLPAAYLHLEYYFTNRGEVVFLEQDKLTYYDNKKQAFNLNFMDINKVILYVSGKVESDGICFGIQNSHYHYIRIITKTKKEIVITNLMHPNLYKIMEELDGFNLVIKRRLFCSVLGNNRE